MNTKSVSLAVREDHTENNGWSFTCVEASSDSVIITPRECWEMMKTHPFYSLLGFALGAALAVSICSLVG